MLRSYKINALIFNSQEIGEYGTVECDMSDCITIPLENDNERYNRKKAIREKKKMEQHDRAKIKRMTQQEIDRYYEEDEYELR